jgi:hypothetical protein
MIPIHGSGMRGGIVVLLLLVALAAAARAEPTRIDVRVLSKGAKFVGTSMGGAAVTIRDAMTGETLAKGRTVGSTGDTGRIMKELLRHHDPVSTPDAAVFHAELDLDEPVRIEVTAEGPLAQAQAMNRASVTQWLVPGKHVTGGDGLLLELPGLIVDVLDPPAHVKVVGVPQTLRLRANVAMMCGCPIEPGGPWDAAAVEVVALLARDGKPAGRVPLRYAGSTSQFEGSLELREPGAWEIAVYAYERATGNTGLDRTTVVVEVEAR